MAGVNAYKDKVVSTSIKGLTGLIKAKGIDIIEGRGRLTGPTTVQVTGNDGQVTDVEGAHIVLATGSVPRSLPGLDIDGDKVISSDHALGLDRVPASAVVLGG